MINLNRKKRILVLNYEFPPLGGGASPVSYELAKKLSETDNFEIDVVTMSYNNLPKYEEINKNFRIFRVKSWRSKKELCHPWEQATYLVSGWFKCVKLIKNNQYDTCHCHFIIPTGVLALFLKKRFKLPYIVTSHGSDVLGYNARFKLLYPFLVGLWKRILDNAQKIITPSSFLKSEILKIHPKFGSNRIIVIPNGFDVDKFKPQKKEKYIFSSGRLLVNKGFQYLIQAVSEEDVGYEVHIAGDGPMMSELKELSSKSKTKIIFHGWISNERKEYRDLLERSTVFILMSEAESFGMSFIEAMCAGCVVITTNVSGCVETVGDAGLLVSPKNSVDLKSKIKNILDKPKKIEEFKDRALNRAKRYDWAIVLEKYIEIIFT